jgi:hypothetical protein
MTSIDELEDAIDSANLSFDTLIFSYRDLISELLDAGAFNTIQKADLQRVCNFLNRVSTVLKAKDEEAREKIRTELWIYADENKGNSDLYNLARSLILMYGDTAEWDDAPDPIIFYFFLYLRKIIPEIEPHFVKHFKGYLLGLR